MCGVIGVWANPTEENIHYIKRLFEESQIRGKHATGLSFISDGIVSVVNPVPAREFVKEFDFNLFKTVSGSDWKIKLIGHCRYSTSDLEFNQPIFNQNFSIVHNGVITQEDPELWKKHFGYDCKTRNDSELILKAFENGKEPIDEYKHASISALILSKRDLCFFRNSTRPLWYTERGEDYFIASTKDILIRVFGEDVKAYKCESGAIYNINDNGFVVYSPQGDWDDFQVDLPCSDYYKQVAL